MTTHTTRCKACHQVRECRTASWKAECTKKDGHIGNRCGNCWFTNTQTRAQHLEAIAKIQQAVA